MSQSNGSTLKVTPDQKVKCEVTYTGDYVSVKSPTGKVVDVRCNVLGRVDPALYAILCDEDFIDATTDVELLPKQMKSLLNCVNVKLASTMNQHQDKQAEKTSNRVLNSVETLNQQDRVHDMESRLKAQKNIVEKLRQGGGLYQVNYYIPVELSVTDRDHGINEIRCPSPASVFYAHAVHLDGSNWLFTKEGLDSPAVKWFFDNWEEHKDFRGREHRGPEGWVVRYHDDEIENLVRKAEKRICDRIRELHTALITNISSADEALKKAQDAFDANTSQNEQSKVFAQRQNKVRAILKKKAEELDQAIQAAERYDMHEDLSDLFSGLRSAIRSQVEDFNRVAEECGFKPSTVEI